MSVKAKKYYTWLGLEGIYTDYNSANQEVVKKGMKNIYPVAFSTEEDADAFRKGMWNEYLKEHYARFFTDADAVIYADGSNDKNLLGGYGIIIFFKTGEVFCESAQLRDLEDGKMSSKRYGINGELTEEKTIVYHSLEDAKKGFVASGWNEAGEFEGARRALEICFEGKKIKKAVLVYDSKTIEERYHLGKKSASTIMENPAYFYGELCEKIKQNFGEEAVTFQHVDSHRKENPYRIDEPEFVHAVFNDLADAMAKAETGIGEVSAQENVNLMHAIPETTNLKINTRNKKTDENRNKTRAHLQAVLAKEWLRPQV